MDEALIVGIVLISIFIVAMVYIFAKIIGFQKMVGTYFYHYGPHKIAVGVTAKSLSLYIDGDLVDERKALNVYVCTLCSELGGVWIRARVDGRLGRMRVGVTADDVSLPFDRKES